MAMFNHRSKPTSKNISSSQTHPLRTVRCAVAALALSSALLSLVADAATALWSPEQVVTNLQASNIRTAVNVSGVSAVVWNQYIPGSADSTHLYGRWQVYAAVCKPQPFPQTPVCSTPFALTDGLTIPDATNAGIVVAPSGAVTAFWNSLATPTVYSVSSTSTDSGQTWSSEPIPASPGFTLMSGVFAQVAPSVGIDAQGNIIAALVNPPTLSTVMRSGYSVQALTKKAGTWSAPVQLSNNAGIFGSARLFVNSDGQALLNMGFATYRRDANGNWGAQQAVNIAGMGQIYSASAGFDAGGKGYFVYRTRYGGAFLSTSTATATTPDPGWSKPKHIAKFDILGSSLVVKGSSAGHAIIYGNDYNTGNIRAAITADGGATWSALTNFGLGNNPNVASSENGLFALSWDSAGVNYDRYMVATGTGIGTGTAAWLKKNLSNNFATGPVAIAGDVAGGNAYAFAAWDRVDALNNVLGVSSGIISP